MSRSLPIALGLGAEIERLGQERSLHCAATRAASRFGVAPAYTCSTSSGRMPCSVSQRFQTMVSRSFGNGRMTLLALQIGGALDVRRRHDRVRILGDHPPIITALPPLPIARIAVSKVETRRRSDPPPVAAPCWRHCRHR